MKRQIVPCGIFALLLLPSCNRTQQTSEINQIDIAEGIEKLAELKVSDLGKTIQYIPLETTDSCFSKSSKMQSIRRRKWALAMFWQTVCRGLWMWFPDAANKKSEQSELCSDWRRWRDLNPRAGFLRRPHGFQDRSLQPLGYISKCISAPTFLGKRREAWREIPIFS